MDSDIRPGPGRRPLHRSSVRQHLSAIKGRIAAGFEALDAFEIDASTQRVVFTMRVQGMSFEEIEHALRCHPQVERRRTVRQIVHILECAKKEFETFVMEADRNGAGIKSRIVEANTKQSV